MPEPVRLKAISRTSRVPHGWLLEPRSEFPEVAVLFSNNLHGPIVPSARDRRNKICLSPQLGCALFLKIYFCGLSAWDMVVYDGIRWVRPRQPADLLVTGRLTLCRRFGPQVVGFPLVKPGELLEHWKNSTLGFLKCFSDRAA